MKREFQHLRPSDENAVPYLLRHIDEVRKLVDQAFQTVSRETSEMTPFKWVCLQVYWKSLITFKCVRTKLT